jgi:bloom syndrome protein
MIGLAVFFFIYSMLRDFDASDKEKDILSTSKDLLSKPERMMTQEPDAKTNTDGDGKKHLAI